MMFSRLCTVLLNSSKSVAESPKPGLFKTAPLFACIFAFLLVFAVGCESNKDAPPSGETSKLIQRGKAIYQTQCIACHHPDPKKPGALGPDVFGSSKALLEARILKAEYPAGYKPKRETHTMVALPHLKYEIDALEAYLNASEN